MVAHELKSIRDFFATFSHNQKLFLLPRLKKGCSGTRLNVTDGGQSSTLKSSLLANRERKRAGSPEWIECPRTKIL